MLHFNLDNGLGAILVAYMLVTTIGVAYILVTTIGVGNAYDVVLRD